MLRVVLLVGLFACETTEAELPAVAPLPPAPKPAPPKPAVIERLEVRHGHTLCMHDTTKAVRCVKLTLGVRDPVVRPVAAPATIDEQFELAGEACRYDGSTLACGTVKHQLAQASSQHFAYLHAADRIYWYQHALGVKKLSEFRTPGGGIAQLSVGFRATCALAGNGEVWCWSDPAAPKRVATPAKVSEIMVQDPFGLCVRTVAGEVHCTPPYVSEVSDLKCHKSKIHCGTGSVEATELTTSFDPVVPLTRPLRRVKLPHLVEDLVRDEDQMYLFCLESLAAMLEPLGGCTLDTHGEVTCFAPCSGTWQATRVKGMPAATRIWSGDTTGYALSTDGQLWWWPRGMGDECAKRTDPTATRLLDTTVTDVTPPLFVQDGPQSWAIHRCALGTDGKVRCWPTDHDGRPGAAYDPTR